jgi:putative ergosteryl-3beta-O-L-aspartate hydrolase
MDIGMSLHQLAPPMAPNPSRTITIPIETATAGVHSQTIELLFYFPEDYEHSLKKWPVVINFHGGGMSYCLNVPVQIKRTVASIGFTIGRPSDDARWARALVEYAGSVVVSVGYRLAPEYRQSI